MFGCIGDALERVGSIFTPALLVLPHVWWVWRIHCHRTHSRIITAWGRLAGCKVGLGISKGNEKWQNYKNLIGQRERSQVCRHTMRWWKFHKHRRCRYALTTNSSLCAAGSALWVDGSGITPWSKALHLPCFAWRHQGFTCYPGHRTEAER